MSGLIAGLYEDWISLDERIDTIASGIEKISEKEASCQRPTSVPGIGPLISTSFLPKADLQRLGWLVRLVTETDFIRRYRARSRAPAWADAPSFALRS
jgi:transposase